MTQHEALVPQHRVEQPQGGQRQLEPALPAGCFLPRAGRRGGPRQVRTRPGRAIHGTAAANTQSRCGLLRIAERAGGITMRNRFGPMPMIRRGGWRVPTAQGCAASRLASRGSRWPGAVPAVDSGRPRIPGQRIMGTPTAYFIGGLHCGVSGELNVAPVPGQCVMQNNKVRRRSSSQRRERDLGRGA